MGPLPIEVSNCIDFTLWSIEGDPPLGTISLGWTVCVFRYVSKREVRIVISLENVLGAHQFKATDYTTVKRLTTLKIISPPLSPIKNISIYTKMGPPIHFRPIRAFYKDLLNKLQLHLNKPEILTFIYFKLSNI